MTRLVLDHEVPGGYREEPAPPGVKVNSRAPLRGVRVESFDCVDEPRSVYLLDLPAREAGYLAERVDRVMEESDVQIRRVVPDPSMEIFDAEVEKIVGGREVFDVTTFLYRAGIDVVMSDGFSISYFESYHRELFRSFVEHFESCLDEPWSSDDRGEKCEHHIELVVRFALCKVVIGLYRASLPVDWMHSVFGLMLAAGDDDAEVKIGEDASVMSASMAIVLAVRMLKSRGEH